MVKTLIQNVTPRYIFHINSHTQTVAKFGVQGNILNIFQFYWDGWCYFCEEEKAQLTMQKLQLVFVLVTMNNEVNGITQAVL